MTKREPLPLAWVNRWQTSHGLAEEFGQGYLAEAASAIPLPTSFLANTEWQSVFVIELTPPFDDTVGLTKPGTKDAE